MVVTLIALAILGADTGIPADEFERLHAELAPDLEAPWRSIPWRVSLLEARSEAARQKKPLFIWAMDGHPLGCT